MGLILLVLGGISATWICGDVLCFVSGIALIVTGIVTLKKHKKFFSVLCIIIGVAGLAISLIMLLPILDIWGKNDGINGFLDGFERYAKGFAAADRLDGYLTFISVNFSILAFTVWAWVSGIRTARKLKSIGDVDTYNKKIKLSVFLFFLGTAGIGASIFAVRELINNIKYT